MVSGTPSKNPTMATDSVTMVLCLMIHSVPISSTMAVTRVSSRQNYKPGDHRPVKCFFFIHNVTSFISYRLTVECYKPMNLGNNSELTMVLKARDRPMGILRYI